MELGVPLALSREEEDASRDSGLTLAHKIPRRTGTISDPRKSIPPTLKLKEQESRSGWLSLFAAQASSDRAKQVFQRFRANTGLAASYPHRLLFRYLLVWADRRPAVEKRRLRTLFRARRCPKRRFCRLLSTRHPPPVNPLEAAKFQGNRDALSIATRT